MWWLSAIAWAVLGVIVAVTVHDHALARFFFTVSLIALATADIKSAIAASKETGRG